MERELTQEEREEIVDGIDCEGFEYYFCSYAHKWEEFPNEISELIKAFRAAQKALEDAIDSWEIEPA